MIRKESLTIKEIAEKLDDTRGNEIYKKAIFSKTFLSLLIENKDTLKDIKFSDEEIAILCDQAMCGDRGIAESFGCELDLPKTIANGDNCCEIRFVRRNK